MKFAIVLLVASIACINGQGFASFAGGNPFAAAFNPYLNGVFGGGVPGAAGPAGSSAAPAAPAAGFYVSSFFQSIVLQKEADRLLNQPNFPADLAERVLNALANAELGFANCNTTTLPWMQIRCIKPALTAAKNELKLIDDEWQARLAATTAAAGSV